MEVRMVTPEENSEQEEHELEETTPVSKPETAHPVDPHMDVTKHAYHLEMVRLDAIYVEFDQQDDDHVKVLADSIDHIGLQNPICVVKNDLIENDTPYRIVSGRQRYKACALLGWEAIPCHLLSYDEEEFAEEKKRLAEYEAPHSPNQFLSGLPKVLS
jgi:hypothetical protein